MQYYWIWAKWENREFAIFWVLVNRWGEKNKLMKELILEIIRIYKLSLVLNYRPFWKF